MNKSNAAGVLIFTGTFVFSISIMIGEALRPAYSVSKNAISDLGVGSQAPLFNDTVILFGVLLIVGALLLIFERKNSFFPYLLIVVGVGATIVGLFPENTGSMHGIGAAIAFIFSGITAIAGIAWIKSAFRYISLFIGILILAATVLFQSGMYYGLGLGGMERLIVYPGFLWSTGFSAYLMSRR